YVAWEQGGLGTSGTGRATMQLAKSLDGGATFPTKTQVAEFVETAVQVPLGLDRILDFPSIAVDRSGGPRNGNIYVVFEEADRDVRDIKLARSTDGGSSFAPAVRVNDDPPGADQFFPWIAVDPTDGQISVISYDRRLSRTPGLTDVFLPQSYDAGVTFQTPAKARASRLRSATRGRRLRPAFRRHSARVRRGSTSSTRARCTGPCWRPVRWRLRRPCTSSPSTRLSSVPGPSSARRSRQR